ncbi:MAG: sulfatase [Planctomycetes bacterium]|nr:sulfatase [Planctomycetota bacterium]
MMGHVAMAISLETAAAAEGPPNVVLIISDDQRWTDFGFMGHDVIRTPRLDRLAAESAVFPRGYVPSSLCRPSLATMISGLYPHQHQITGNDPPPGTDRAAMLKHIRRIPTLPRLLGEAGYLSHQSGKWWEGSYELGGFTHGMTHGDPKRGGRHGDEGLAIGRKGLAPIFDFIEECGEKPFFIWYAPFLPHTPHRPPERLLEKYRAPDRPIELARYYAMCEWFDETCGQLLDHLEEKNLAENTLVAFVTDNGWIQKTPQTKLPEGWRNPFAPKSKRSPYDGGIRTPIMLRWPGQIRPGRYDALASSIDLAPTILAAAGLEAPKEMRGIDLLKVIEAGGKSERDALFGGIYEHDVVDIDRPAAGLLYRWCIAGDWKLIVPADGSAPEVYNLAADPHEERDLAAEKPEVLARLQGRLDAWWPGRG